MLASDGDGVETDKGVGVDNIDLEAAYDQRKNTGHDKPTAYLINTSREGIVNEDALYEALSKGKIVGLHSMCEKRNPRARAHCTIWKIFSSCLT